MENDGKLKNGKISHRMMYNRHVTGRFDFFLIWIFWGQNTLWGGEMENDGKLKNGKISHCMMYNRHVTGSFDFFLYVTLWDGGIFFAYFALRRRSRSLFTMGCVLFVTAGFLPALVKNMQSFISIPKRRRTKPPERKNSLWRDLPTKHRALPL